ncbi:hypothetical protein [Fontibacter flavus]|uniref:DinB family protein n=1 Tax=Fontibacter flavus TaxID=654838 RepID=A0ABV6FV30_9BACT
MMKELCMRNLMEIRSLVSEIDPEAYRLPIPLLFGASIGQLVRKILEKYQASLVSMTYGAVEYTRKNGKVELQVEPEIAIKSIDDIYLQIEAIEKDNYMIMLYDFSEGIEENVNSIETTLFRELAYNLEHSNHHQVLIKIACVILGIEDLLPENFGVDPTIVNHDLKQNDNFLKPKKHAEK